MIEHTQSYVKKNPRLYHILVLVVFLTIYGCATPIAPTGGPPDKEAPRVTETFPVPGTTNFTGDTFEFQFSEFIQRSSVSQNINVEPDLDLEYRIKWKKKKLSITFLDPLPDSTTVILTLGGEITDTKRNKMGRPLTVAVSTGPEIDEGTVTGKIKEAESGRSADGAKVLLYREPFDFSKKATYQAETDTSGEFNFAYLREGTYRAIYVDDRNRNKIWEQGLEDAQPFSKELIELEKAGGDTLDVLYINKPDTIAPRLLGVGLFSSNRLRLRFNENIKIQEGADISVLDTLGEEFSSGYVLYNSQKDPFVAYAQSSNELGLSQEYGIRVNGITDAAGNRAVTEDVIFEGSTQADTTIQRIISHETKNGISPTQSVEVVYAAPIQDPMILDSIVVIEGDVSFDDWPAIEVINNRLFVDPQGTWIEGLTYQFLVWSPNSRRRQLYTPEIWDEVELGDLILKAANRDSGEVFSVSLENESIAFSVDTVFTDSLLIQNLPPVNYTLKVFIDRNSNNRWDQGIPFPFKAPEPYYIQQGVQIRQGFASEIIMQF
ncbi:MAG: hypothetical protein ED557_00260 [Balneola sp.]|nr:MAG: hypothetical protein ED557_00260 [Balneola sp.]